MLNSNFTYTIKGHMTILSQSETLTLGLQANK